MIEARTIYIMAYRQIKRFLRAKSRLIGSIVNPVMWLVFFGLGWSSAFSSPMAKMVFHGLDYMSYLTPGVVMMTIFTASFIGGITVIWDKEFGFLKEILVAPASRRAVILGRALGDALLAVLQGSITFAIASLLVGYINPLAIPVLLLAMFLTAISYACLGSAIGSSVGSVESFQLINMTIAMPMFFLSGTVMPLYRAPWWMRTAALAIPLTYGVDACRSALYGVGMLPLWLDLGVLACIALAFVFLAAAAFERTTIS